MSLRRTQVNLEFRHNSTDEGYLIISKDGDIGIGAEPSEKLDINNGNVRLDNGHTIFFENSSGNVDGTKIWRRSANALALAYEGHYLRFDAVDNQPVVIKDSDESTKIQFHPDGDSWFNSGSVGIGTKTMGDHKLAVEGSIGAREIKVETTTWPDYVFEPTYRLKSLDEIEDYINENNHLPEIPSAAEVTRNGVNLGEMNAKLLQKIEELTLYLIDQNKEIIELKKKVNALERND